MSTPLVSVIVPIYNAESYLKRCLDNLLNQTLREIEIICVNDGSPDKCDEILSAYEIMDSRVIVIKQANRGLAGARNTGLEYASAPYVMFCDPDDYFHKTTCEEMYHCISQPSVDVACCGIKMVYETDVDELTKRSTEDYYRIKFNGLQQPSTEIFINTDVSVCNKIFKLSLIKQYHLFFPEGLHYEDFCFFFRYFCISGSIYFLRKYLYYYVRHGSGIMANTISKSIKSIDHIKILHPIYQFLNDYNLFGKWEQCFLNAVPLCFHFAYRYLPDDKKYMAYDEIIPIMKSLDADAKTILSPLEYFEWNQIIEQQRDIVLMKKIKILGVSIASFKKSRRFSYFSILGIKLWARKAKTDKYTHYILYVPIWKNAVEKV